MYRSYWWARNNKLSFGERIEPPRAGENTLGAAVCRDEPLWRFDLTAASVEKNLALWTRVPGGARGGAALRWNSMEGTTSKAERPLGKELRPPSEI